MVTSGVYAVAVGCSEVKTVSVCLSGVSTSAFAYAGVDVTRLTAGCNTDAAAERLGVEGTVCSVAERVGH